MMLKRLVTFKFAIVVYAIAAPYEDEYGPGYGDEWLLFQDETGIHIMNFSTIPNDTSGLIYGDAYYYLYTRRNAAPEELHIPSDSEQIFTSQYFNPSNLVKVITHGWLSNGNETWLQGIKNEFLIHSDYNIIIIDWSELSTNPIYPWSALSTRYVGRKTARILNSIAKAYNIDGRTMHLLGHSLGAQVMAHTASFLNYTLHRITGMDPARPLFEVPMMPKHYRLDSSDAEFVDIIHTSGGLYGYYTSQGHADFYPNGGSPSQPGCENELGFCSHARANLYFKESINGEPKFNAYPCESWNKFEKGYCTVYYTYMGLQAKNGDKGDFYLHVNSEPPFARNSEFETRTLDSKH